MVSAKIMWNSVIRTHGAKFGGTDIKDMYLKTPLDWYQYMQMLLKLFLDDIIDHYNLREKTLNSYVYMEIQRCMHGYYHKPASWQTSSYDNAWDNMATSNYNTCPVFGSTSPITSGLICASMTLVSNTKAIKPQTPLFWAMHWDIWNCWGLGWWYLLRHQPQVELWQTLGRHCYARLCSQKFHQI